MREPPHIYTAVLGEGLIASGPLPTVLAQVKRRSGRGDGAALIFECQSGCQVDFDLRGTVENVVTRAVPARAHAGPGRPRLGTVSREVSLLPRHWEWLEQQPNGASAALRRLVDEARNREPGRQRARAAMDSPCRFMTAMAGNQPGYEEALRALYAGRRAPFERLIRDGPGDIRVHVERLAGDAFA